MPNLRCKKCKKDLLSIINIKNKNEIVNMIFNRIKDKYKILYEMEPKLYHNELEKNHICDGEFDVVIFERTPKKLRHIDFLYYFKYRKINELRNKLLLINLDDDNNNNKILKSNKNKFLSIFNNNNKFLKRDSNIINKDNEDNKILTNLRNNIYEYSSKRYYFLDLLCISFFLFYVFIKST